MNKNKNKDMSKSKYLMDIINTMITIILSYFIFGFIGIIISFIPDIMLVFIISDLWQKNPKDKLIGWKLKLHLFLHSSIPVLFLVLLIAPFLLLSPYISYFINIVIVLLRICVVYSIHVYIDYAMHSEKYNKYFRGYNI